MLINFDGVEEKELIGFNDGQGPIYMRSHVGFGHKIMKLRIPQGSSIGMHTHTGTSEVEYILEGTATFLIDGAEEIVKSGECHFCPEGSSHSLENRESRDLVLFAVVPQINA